MKILHTSDWHVGRTLSRIPRLEETRAALNEVSDIAGREAVDALIVCGDIFEHLTPSAEAEQVVYETLERFCDQGLAVVLITGNHDHPGRWRALSPLLRRFSVLVCDDLRGPQEGGIVEVSSRDGKETLQVAAVPWVSERRSYTAVDLMGSSEKSYQSYADSMATAMRALCEGFRPGACHLLAGHFFITGAVVSESERALTIGDIYAVTPNAIPTTVQYAALGHVHKPQKGPHVPVPCRYSGSLLQLDFGEAGQEKSVSIIELTPGKPAKVKEARLRSGRRLVDVAGSLEALASYENDVEGTYLRVTVTCDGPQSGLSDQVRDLLPNALIVKLEYPDDQGVVAVDISTKKPRELFDGYLRGRYQTEPSVQLLDAFDQLLVEVSGESGTTAGQLSLMDGAETGLPSEAAPHAAEDAPFRAAVTGG